MKAANLKLGDFVFYKGKPFEVQELTYGLCGGLSSGTYFIGDITAKDLEPIPLTREILEKNGWIVQKAPYKMYAQYRKKGNPTLDEWGNGYHFSCGNRIVDIEYVHQLQHILWAFGIDDYLNI